MVNPVSVGTNGNRANQASQFLLLIMQCFKQIKRLAWPRETSEVFVLKV